MLRIVPCLVAVGLTLAGCGGGDRGGGGPARPTEPPGGAGPAGEPRSPPGGTATGAGAKTKQKAEVAGTVVCVGCHLEKGHGAVAECTLHSRHAQGIVAEDGRLLTFLDNARGHALVADGKLSGKTLRVEGFVFPKAHVLEVTRYAVREGDAYVLYDYCKLCGFEKGDNQGRDLCADCVGD